MKKLIWFFAFAFTCTTAVCCFSENGIAQRRQITPIIKRPANTGVTTSPDENSQKAPTTTSPKKLFQLGVSLYQFGNYVKAESLFAEYRKVSSSEPGSDRELGRLMHAKALIHLNQAAKAVTELKELQTATTSRGLRQEIQFDLGVGESRKGENFSAAQHFIEVAGNNWSTRDSIVIQKKAIMNLRTLAMAHLSLDELLKLANTTVYINLRGVLLFEAMQKCLAGDVFNQAVYSPGNINSPLQSSDTRASMIVARQDSLLKDQLLPAISRLIGTPSLDAVCKIWLESGLQQAKAHQSRSLKPFRIGVLVPTDLDAFDGSETQKAGSQILSGIAFRAYEFNRQSLTDHISLFVRDTYGLDGTHLVKTTASLIDQESVQLILGPIFSEQAVTVSNACAAKGVTMITPTATDEHITLGIRTSFQINPTHNMRGRAIAKYLMQFPTMRTFGIFAERKTYGVEMAEGFRQEVISRGGKIKVYSMLSPKFSNIKETVDTLNRGKGKSKGSQDRKLDAIYLPLTNLESIGIALSQLRFYNFSGQIVGSGDWNDANILNRFEDLVNGVIFATDSYVSYDKPETSRTFTGYQLYWHSRQAPLFWNGYDALDYLTHTLVSAQVTDRSKIADALMIALPYKTTHTDIYFGGGNVNQRMNIMQYQNGKISKIQ